MRVVRAGWRWVRLLAGVFGLGLLIGGGGAAGLQAWAGAQPPAIVAQLPSAEPDRRVAMAMPRYRAPERVRDSRPASRRVPRSAPVTLAFAGDVMFEGAIAVPLEVEPATALDAVRPVLAAADLAVVNLETAVTEAGVAEPKKFNFAAPATGLTALRAAGVDVVSLANNHGMDYGLDGLSDTLEAGEDLGLPLIGAGRTRREAYAPHVRSINGQTIAVLAATQVMDSRFLRSWPAVGSQPGLASAKYEHEARLVAAVEAARATADTVVVFLHWGVELAVCPSEDQRLLAQRLADAGADIVVGGHAHRLQGAGMLGDTLVAYGLGNFAFSTPGGAGAETGVLLVTVNPGGAITYEWEPARIAAGAPVPLRGAEADAAAASWDALRGCTGLEIGRRVPTVPTSPDRPEQREPNLEPA